MLFPVTYLFWARIALEVKKQQPSSGIKILPVGVKYDQTYPHWGAKVKINIGQPKEKSS